MMFYIFYQFSPASHRADTTDAHSCHSCLNRRETWLAQSTLMSGASGWHAFWTITNALVERRRTASEMFLVWRAIQCIFLKAVSQFEIFIFFIYSAHQSIREPFMLHVLFLSRGLYLGISTWKDCLAIGYKIPFLLRGQRSLHTVDEALSWTLLEGSFQLFQAAWPIYRFKKHSGNCPSAQARTWPTLSVGSSQTLLLKFWCTRL